MPIDSVPASTTSSSVPPFNEIIRFIKEYDGNELYLSKFIRDLTFAKEACGKDENLAKRVLNYSITQLVGKAAQVTTYLTFNTFEELTTHLVDSFGRRKNLAELEHDLSDIKQAKGESIAEFYNKLQETMFSLIGAVTRDVPVALGEIKIESIKNCALNKFHYAINDRIASMIRSAKPRTLEEAYSIAINEERALIMTDTLNFGKPHLNLLIDSGADISLIKIKSIDKRTYINKGIIVKLNGIGSIKTSTLGCIHVIFQLGKYMTKQIFHVIPDDTNVPYDGLLGMDFLNKTNALLNFKDNKILLYGSEYKINTNEPNIDKYQFLNNSIPIKKSSSEQNILNQLNSNKVGHPPSFLNKLNSNKVGYPPSFPNKKGSKDERNISNKVGKNSIFLNKNNSNSAQYNSISNKKGSSDERNISNKVGKNPIFPNKNNSNKVGKNPIFPNKISSKKEQNTLNPIKYINTNSSDPNNMQKVNSRTETIIKIHILNPEIGEGIIPFTEISKDIFLCKSIVKINNNSEAITSIVNATDKDYLITNFSIFLEPLQEFNVLTCNQINNKSASRKENLSKNIRTSHLNKEEKDSLISLCQEFNQVFYLEGDILSQTNTITHQIRTNDHPPIYTKTYRYPEAHKSEVDLQINKMLDQNIIKPSVLPWSSPVWVVPKKADASGKKKWRIVIDYRKLNDISVGDAYPLPNITDILDQLGHSTYFTTLDLAQGFHQIPMNSEDSTAFSVNQGLFQFNRMPFGLKGAPATFQRLMDRVLTGLQGLKCFVYLDDIIIYANSIEDHHNKLKQIFLRLDEHNLKLQPDKCEFMRTEVAYLGHIISDKGVKPNPDKITAITNYPVPRNTKEIKAFLGLIGYYRRFIENFSKLSQPLTYLLKKDVPFEFNEKCTKSFNELRTKLITEPLLKYPDFKIPFNLTTDASNFAIGSILSQGDAKNDFPIAYASRTLNKAEHNYSTTERELLAIVWSVNHFRPYLYGRKFYVFTDHKPLQWLFNVKNPSSRLARWKLKLLDYDIEIKYKSGITNTNADALSRINTELNANILLTEQEIEDILNEEDTILSPNTIKDLRDILLKKDNPSTPDIIQEIENELPNTLLDSPELPQPEENPSGSLPNVTNPPEKRNLIKIIPEEKNYKNFMVRYNHNLIDFNANNIVVTKENLFKINDNLAHCVSKDMEMSAGLALDIKNKISNYNDLKALDSELYGVTTSQFNGKGIYHLITKQFYWQKPSHEDLFKTLLNFQILLNLDDCESLRIPQLGCGLDKLHWFKVKSMIYYIFANTKIKITICSNELIHPTPEQIPQILKEYHDTLQSGHPGIHRMLEKLKMFYMWKTMRKDVENYVKSCIHCQTKISKQPKKAPLEITTTSRKPFERLALDLVGPYRNFNPITENKYILTMQDDLTKYSVAIPIKDKTAISVANGLINNFILIYGLPESLLTDQGTEFNNDLIKQLCKMLKVKHLKTTAYHPETNGALERMHATLSDFLKTNCYENSKDWEKLIPYFTFSYNTTPHSATKITPYELIFGKTASIPTSVYRDTHIDSYPTYLAELKTTLTEMQRTAREQLMKQKQYYVDKQNEKKQTHKKQYEIEDYIYLIKLIPLFISSVICRQQENSYSIQEIKKSPGLYYEEVANLYFFNSSWKLVVHYDLTTLDERLTVIHKYVEKMIPICPKQIFQCRKTLAYLQKRIPILDEKTNTISHLLGHQRPKRSPFNFIGTISKTLFGTLDADDAERYNKAIDQVENDEKEILNLLNVQTQVVQDAITNFNHSTESILATERIFNKNLIKIQNFINSTENEVRNRSQISLIDTNIQLLSNYIEDYQSDVETIVDCILFSLQGIIHPSIISPQNILRELLRTVAHLPKGLNYPTPLNIDEIYKLQKTLDLISYYMDNKIIYILSIPLIKNEKFTLYHTIPLPIKSKNHFLFIQPSQSKLAISETRNHYALLENVEDCKHIDVEQLICKRNVVILSTHNKPICEVTLLINKKIENCKTYINTKSINIWYKLYKPNAWLYILSEPSDVTLNCKNENLKDFKLQNTGILTLNKECHGYTNQITLTTAKDIETNYNAVIPSIDITTDECCHEENLNNSIKIPSLEPLQEIDTNLENLYILSQRIYTVKDKIHEIYNSHNIHKSFISKSTIRPGNYHFFWAKKNNNPTSDSGDDSPEAEEPLHTESQSHPRPSIRRDIF